MSMSSNITTTVVTPEPTPHRVSGLLFCVGIFNFLSLVAGTVALLPLAVHRLMDWYEDPMRSSLGVPCAHAAIVHFTMCAMSPGLLTTCYLFLFHDNLLAGKAYLLYLVLAILVSFVVIISFNELYGLTLFIAYSFFAVIACLSMRGKNAETRTRHCDVLVNYRAVEHSSNAPSQVISE